MAPATRTTLTSTVSALPDDRLLAQARELARHERALRMVVLDHLREIAARRLFLRRGFGSLFDYTIRASICKFCNSLRATPISRYCFRNPFVVCDHPCLASV